MLRDKQFHIRYSTGKADTPFNFFELALSNSVKFEIGLGYFSSASFNVLSVGFARFINSGGTIKMYINQYLTEEDYELLLKHDEESYFNERLINSYDKLRQTFSIRDTHFFECLSFLIQNERIQIKIVIPKGGGLAHEKFGIFTDGNGDQVAFTGSMNLTAAALMHNYETIECACSWKGDDSKERVQVSQDDFYTVWNGQDKNISVYEAKEFAKKIVKDYPIGDIKLLIQNEKKIIKQLELEDKISSTYLLVQNKEPHFPLKYPDGPREYQKEAYHAWVKNDKQGIFAMATGTGKTITSLNCVLEEYKEDDFYQILILVPTIALVDQWQEEVSLFNFRNIISVYSGNPKWRQELVRLKNNIVNGLEKNFVLLSTYQSFLHQDFQKLLSQFPESVILLADEAHNIGATSVKRAFGQLKMKRRIALSATPSRVYDEEGTEELERFFNDQPPYVYSYSMKEAIDNGVLMKYRYYPRIVYLNNDEMEDYASITAQLVRMYNSETQSFSDPEKAARLLLIRKRILHKAADKIRVYKQIINEIGGDQLKYCFVYVPEGGKMFDSDEARLHSTIDFDDSSDDSTIYEESFIQKMLDVTKEQFPKITCNTYTGSNTKKEREIIFKDFENGFINVLFAMKCLDEGVDVPRAEYGIFASSTGNPRQFIQRRGRLLRRHEDKTFAHVYDMIVVPNFKAEVYSDEHWKMERNLVKNELKRVAEFASLSSNYFSDVESILKEVTEYYEISLSSLVLNINH